MTIPIPNPHVSVTLLAFFQSTQLNLFERFLTQAVSQRNRGHRNQPLVAAACHWQS
jgi:hypothetical protein